MKNNKEIKVEKYVGDGTQVYVIKIYNASFELSFKEFKELRKAMEEV